MYKKWLNKYEEIKNNYINETKAVACCPVCCGRGYVESGFYESFGTTWVSSTTGCATCRSCGGKGYIKL